MRSYVSLCHVIRYVYNTCDTRNIYDIVHTLHYILEHINNTYTKRSNIIVYTPTVHSVIHAKRFRIV